ncbi:Copper binding protein, plastocyanin/azurin family [Halogranum amylolyticum]|uniref:Copper binding protein, plastocyanin/azurin family n=1 Tax=Halogranum amylolyticum TaxID=660520 RepID=A0A1H8RRE2_9EURY|nr:plastocyanin/azurin family copper-binding protein [Halogranum amylolyticum]SEO69041.1 Copper binding protein, plastocyanin/azurin family [Halogranum amylolyticum]
MTETTNEPDENEYRRETTVTVPRRAVLAATGATTGMAFGMGTVAAHGERERGDCGESDGPDGGAADPTALDPVFGVASQRRNPCSGAASSDCFEEFPRPIRPSHEVEMQIGLPGPLVALAEQGGLSRRTTESINEEVADGRVTPGNLHNPETTVSIRRSGGETESLTVTEIAQVVRATTGFHFNPAGIAVAPGDIVVFSAETPDHAVAAFHERHGRQNRVPDGVGPIASPLIPVGGYWLYRFETPGVYDLYCPPHQVFGMVMRVVVHEGDGEVPSPSIENTGRPPQAENELATILGGLDPNVPSSLEVLQAEVLAPENVVEEGTVTWDAVLKAHRGQ